jgi:hypothetical protein
MIYVGSGLAASGQATTGLSASLDAKQQVPPQVYKASDASGRFTGTLTRTTSNGVGKLVWTLSYSKLSGPATIAYVEVPRSGKAAEIVVQLCHRCTSDANGVVMPLTAGVTNAISTRASFVVIRTKKNPSGEITGRITH